MKKFISLTFALIAVLSVTVSASADTATAVSDTSVTVYGPLDEYHAPGDSAWGSPQQAVETWKHPSWPTLPSAYWISNSYYIEGNISGNTWRWFRKTVNLCEGAYDVSGTVTANSDNAEEVYVNESFVDSEGTVTGPADNLYWWATPKNYDFVASGDTLVFDFIVRNYAGPASAEGNPTGLIFTATIDYSCPLEVAIDIKPGSFPSCFNNDGNGLIPVVVFGSGSFDVREVELSTVELQGLPVARKPNGRFMAAYEDWNLDGYEDLLLKFVDESGLFDLGAVSAKLTGELLDGTPFFGVGDICVR